MMICTLYSTNMLSWISEELYKPVIYMDKNSVRENLWNFCFNCLFVAEKMAVLYIIIIIMLKFKKWIIFYKIKRSHQLCFTVATQSLSVIPDIFWEEHKTWHYTHLLTLSVYYGYLFCYVIYLCVKIFLEACKFLRYKTHLYLNFMFSILMQWKKIMYVTFLCQNFVTYKLHHCGLTMVMCQLNNAKTYIPLQVYLGQISCLYQHTQGDLLDISLLLQLLLPSFPLDVTASYHLHYTYNDTDKYIKAKG